MRVRPVWLLFAVFTLEACGLGRRVRPEAFGPGKSMAVVSIYSTSKVAFSRESPFLGLSGNHQGSTRMELAKTSEVFADTKAAVLRVLASSRHLRLMPEQAVLSSGVYAAARSEEPNRLGLLRLVTPPRYKLLLDRDRIGTVARGVGARGGLTVRLDHDCASGERWGTVVGNVHVAIGAIGRSGETIWLGYDRARADIPVPVGGGKVDLSALRRSLAQSAERATRKIVQDLDERLRMR